MAFRKVDTSSETVKDYTGNENYLNKSGMYSVILESVILDKTEKGSEFLNFWLSCNGVEQPLFNAIRLTNNDGKDNLEAKILSKLCVIAGIDEIADPISRMVPIGKKGEEKECMVLADFDKLPIHIRLQMEYDIYEGKIQERKHVRNLFRFGDYATAAEIVNKNAGKEDIEFGKQYKVELETAENVKYNGGLTEEDVKEWKKNRKKDDNQSKDNKPASGFSNQKRFGNGSKK